MNPKKMTIVVVMILAFGAAPVLTHANSYILSPAKAMLAEGGKEGGGGKGGGGDKGGDKGHGEPHPHESPGPKGH